MLAIHVAKAETDGSLRWGFTAGGLIVSSPAISADGTIYVGARLGENGGRMLAIQPSGRLLWEFKTPDWVDSSPAIGPDGTVYFGCWDGKFYALNAAGGKKWTFDTNTFVYSSPAIGADGTIYVGSGANALHAINPDGTEKWRKTVDGWVDTAPAIGANGTIYFGSWDNNIYAVSTNGTELWRFDTKAIVLASPALGSDGSIYVGSTNWKLFALTPAGKLKWEYTAGGSIQASPAIGPDGTIYFGASDWNFYAVKPDGTLKWKYYVGQPVLSTAAVRTDGTVIFGADDRRIRALNADGTLKWSIETGDMIESSPVIASDGTIYIGAFDNKLYSINGNGTPLSQYSSWPMFRGSAAHNGRTYSEASAGNLVNLSTRGIGGNSRNLIVGFVVKDSASRRFLIRAVGPTLSMHGVSQPLSDPNLNLHMLPSNFLLYGNDDWEDGEEGVEIASTGAAVGAFPFMSGSKDAAFISVLPSGSYAAAVGSKLSEEGVVLAEIYDAVSAIAESSNAINATSNAPRGLVNLSTRGYVGTGNNILISGLVVGQGSDRRVLIRAVGPGLTKFGVNNTLSQPQLDIYSGATRLYQNTGWASGNNLADMRAAQADAWAFTLDEGSADCAMLVTLPSGNYTLQVSGRNGTTGEALIEVYVTP